MFDDNVCYVVTVVTGSGAIARCTSGRQCNSEDGGGRGVELRRDVKERNSTGSDSARQTAVQRGTDGLPRRSTTGSWWRSVRGG